MDIYKSKSAAWCPWNELTNKGIGSVGNSTLEQMKWKRIY
jgi:hypothetical protein